MMIYDSGLLFWATLYMCDVVLSLLIKPRIANDTGCVAKVAPACQLDSPLYTWSGCAEVRRQPGRNSNGEVYPIRLCALLFSSRVSGSSETPQFQRRSCAKGHSTRSSTSRSSAPQPVHALHSFQFGCFHWRERAREKKQEHPSHSISAAFLQSLRT